MPVRAAAEERSIPNFAWDADPDDIHLIRGSDMRYPLGEELLVFDGSAVQPAIWYRPVLAGFEEYAETITHDQLEIDGQGRLTIPEDADLGSFLLQIQLRDGDDELDDRQRRVHVHDELTALWVDPPRLTVRQGHRVRPRILAVFDDPDGDGTGAHATAVELTDRAFGRLESYTSRYILLGTDDDELITLRDPEAPDAEEDSWELRATADAGEAGLWASIRPDRAGELGLEDDGDPDGDPDGDEEGLLASPAIELVAAPAFNEVPEEHRRLRHVAGQWPAISAGDATNILFLAEGFRANGGVDDLLLDRVAELLGASDPDDAQSLRSPTHSPWDQLLEQGRLNIFLAHLPSEQDGVTLAYRGVAPDGSGDHDQPYDPPPTRRIEDLPIHPFRPQIYQRPPPDPDPDEGHEWTFFHVLHVVGHPNRNDRDADHLATIEAWHQRFAADGSIPAMFVEGAAPQDQPIDRDVFDTWRRYAEPRFVDGRDTAFGLAVGRISQDNTHPRFRSPRWGVYPDISHINTYLMGLLPPEAEDGEEPDQDLVARWMDPEGDLEENEPDDIAGQDRPFVYLLINGVHVRGHHQPSDNDLLRYMVSGLHRNPPGTHRHVRVEVPDPDPDEEDRPDRHWRATLVPSAAPMTEREETSLIGTIVHELHHAIGLGDEYEGSSGLGQQQLEVTINLVPPLEDDDADDGAALLDRGLPWDVARARWADRIENVEATDEGHLRVTLLDRSEEHRPPEEVLGHLRIRRPLARRTDADDLQPPAVSVQLEVDEDASDYPRLVLRAADGGDPPDADEIADDSVLFAPVLADEDDPSSWLRLVSPPIRAHLEAGNILNPDHDCDGDNPKVTQPEDLPPDIDAGRSPARIVGVYLGGARSYCGAYRPTGISRMRSSYPEAENLDLNAGDEALQDMDTFVDLFSDQPLLSPTMPRLQQYRTVLEWELTFPPSVVEGYAVGDQIDPAVLGAVDRAHAIHIPEGDQ